MISDRQKSIYRWIVILWSRKKKLSDSLISSNFESIDRYYRGTDNRCSASIKQVNKKKASEKNQMEFFEASVIYFVIYTNKTK